MPGERVCPQGNGRTEQQGEKERQGGADLDDPPHPVFLTALSGQGEKALDAPFHTQQPHRGGDGGDHHHQFINPVLLHPQQTGKHHHKDDAHTVLKELAEKGNAPPFGGGYQVLFQAGGGFSVMIGCWRHGA